MKHTVRTTKLSKKTQKKNRKSNYYMGEKKRKEQVLYKIKTKEKEKKRKVL